MLRGKNQRNNDNKKNEHSRKQKNENNDEINQNIKREWVSKIDIRI